jgi:quinolinate synthase
MVTWCRNHPSPAIIVATEAGMLHRLEKECPGKTFIPAPTENCRCNECRFMKMNTLEKVRDCLLNGTPEITLPEDVRAAAEIPLRRMLEWSR